MPGSARRLLVLVVFVLAVLAAPVALGLLAFSDPPIPPSRPPGPDIANSQEGNIR